MRGYRQRIRRKRSTPPPTVNRLLAPLEIGEKVVIDVHPSVQKGRPDLRFNGLVGTVVGKQGRSYVVKIKDKGKTKKIIAPTIHLRRLA